MLFYYYPIIPEKKLAFVAIPKNAGTSVRVSFAKAMGLMQSSDDPSTIYKKPWPGLANKQELSDIKLQNFTRFCIIRHPFDRLVSCWKNKLSHEGFISDSDSLFEPDMDFDSFVNSAFTVHDKNADRHYRSQYRFLFKGQTLLVDRMLRYEFLNEDWDILCREYGLPPLVTHNKSDDTRPWQEFYENNNELIAKVADRYQVDMGFFGYNLDQIKKGLKMRYRLANLEIHASHACNLACRSCSHFSDHNHKGNISVDEAKDWMGNWNQRLIPKEFSLLGGEPLLNKNICELVETTRSYWPDSRIRLVTNGLLLSKHPDLPKVLNEVGNCTLRLTIHYNSAEFQDKLAPELSLLRNWVANYENFDIRISSGFEGWTRRYNGVGSDMRSFTDKNPEGSWAICQSKYCRQLYLGKLWKCPPLTYLNQQNEKFSLHDSWDPYLAYKPLGPDCSNKELKAWLNLETEKYCNMCPSFERPFIKPNPLKNKSLSDHAKENFLSDPLFNFVRDQPKKANNPLHCREFLLGS